MCLLLIKTYSNKTHSLGKYEESIISVIFELAKQSAFHPTPLKLFLDFWSRLMLSLPSLLEDTSHIPLPFEQKVEDRPFPAKMVLYITTSGYIAIKGHKKKLLG